MFTESVDHVINRCKGLIGFKRTEIERASGFPNRPPPFNYSSSSTRSIWPPVVLVSAVARPNGQPRQAGVARGVRGHAPPPPRNFEL